MYRYEHEVEEFGFLYIEAALPPGGHNQPFAKVASQSPVQ